MEGKKLKYPRKRVIRSYGHITDIIPILDFANKYKRGEKARVVVKEYSEKAFLSGKQIPRVSVTFYSYEPVGILREKCIDIIHKSEMTGFFNIDGYTIFKR